MLLDRLKSCLLVVDIQEKLIGLIHEHEKVRVNSAWMIRVAQSLNIPVLVSEQYPKGLKPTIQEIKSLVSAENVMGKVHFSCAADTGCKQRIDDLKRSQVVLVGIESHVCVLQTAINLLEHNKQVFVVVDAVSSRNPVDVKYALKRMAKAGVELVTREMVFFEWLHQAGTAEFKQMSQEFLKE